MQALAGTLRYLVLVLRNDVDQGLAHSAVSGHEKIDILVLGLLEELLVDVLDGRSGILRSQDHGNVPLRRTLCHGPDADAPASEGGQHPAGRAALIDNVVTHQADNGVTFLHLQRIEFSKRNLICEAGICSLLCQGCVLLCNGHAHRIDRRRLSDEDNADIVLAERLEKPVGESRHTYHSASLEGKQGNVVRIGNADDLVPAVAPRRILLDECTLPVRVEGTFDVYRNALGHNRLDCRRIDDLGPEMRKLEGGPVRNIPYQ